MTIRKVDTNREMTFLNASDECSCCCTWRTRRGDNPPPRPPRHLTLSHSEIMNQQFASLCSTHPFYFSSDLSSFVRHVVTSIIISVIVGLFIFPDSPPLSSPEATALTSKPFDLKNNIELSFRDYFSLPSLIRPSPSLEPSLFSRMGILSSPTATSPSRIISYCLAQSTVAPSSSSTTIFTLGFGSPTLLSGGLTACLEHINATGCVGGIATFVTLGHNLTDTGASDAVVIIPQIVVETPFVQMHPHGLSVNLDVYRKVNVSNFFAYPSFFTQSGDIYERFFKEIGNMHHDNDGTVISPIASNLDVPTSSQWRNIVSNFAIFETLDKKNGKRIRIGVTRSVQMGQTWVSSAGPALVATIRTLRNKHVDIVVLTSGDLNAPFNVLLPQLGEDQPDIFLDMSGSNSDDKFEKYFYNYSSSSSSSSSSSFLAGVVLVGSLSGSSQGSFINLRIDSESHHLMSADFTIVDVSQPLPPALRASERYLDMQTFLVGEAQLAASNDPLLSHTLVDVPKSRVDGYYPCLGGECVQGTLYTQAYRWFYETDIAMTNSGGPRGPGWAAGPVKTSDVWALMPFVNYACTGTILGLKIWELVNLSMAFTTFTSAYNSVGDRFLQTAGLQIDYDNSTASVLAGTRVRAIRVLDRLTNEYKPLERLKLYTYATDYYQCTSMPDISPILRRLYDGETMALGVDNNFVQVTIQQFLKAHDPYDPVILDYLTRKPVIAVVPAATASAAAPAAPPMTAGSPRSSLARRESESRPFSPAGATTANDQLLETLRREYFMVWGQTAASCSLYQYWSAGVATCMDCADESQRDPTDGTRCVPSASLSTGSSGGNEVLIIAIIVPIIVVVCIIAAALLIFILCFGTNIKNVRDTKYAPKGDTATIIFTDIQMSTKLWGTVPASMGAALDQHHAMIRAAIAAHGGYEVKTVGDSFMIAVETPQKAADISMQIQMDFMRAKWPRCIDLVYAAEAEGDASVVDLIDDDPSDLIDCTVPLISNGGGDVMTTNMMVCPRSATTTMMMRMPLMMGGTHSSVDIGGGIADGEEEMTPASLSAGASYSFKNVPSLIANSNINGNRPQAQPQQPYGLVEDGFGGNNNVMHNQNSVNNDVNGDQQQQLPILTATFGSDDEDDKSCKPSPFGIVNKNNNNNNNGGTAPRNPLHPPPLHPSPSAAFPAAVENTANPLISLIRSFNTANNSVNAGGVSSAGGIAAASEEMGAVAAASLSSMLSPREQSQHVRINPILAATMIGNEALPIGHPSSSSLSQSPPTLSPAFSQQQQSAAPPAAVAISPKRQQHQQEEYPQPPKAVTFAASPPLGTANDVIRTNSSLSPSAAEEHHQNLLLLQHNNINNNTTTSIQQQQLLQDAVGGSNSFASGAGGVSTGISIGGGRAALATAQHDHLPRNALRNFAGIRVRIGIHCGPVDAIFDEVAKGYDYYGNTVNLAARLEAAGQGGQIIVSRQIANALPPSDGRFIVESLGSTELRGVSGRTEVLQLIPTALRGRVFAPKNGNASALQGGEEGAQRGNNNDDVSPADAAAGGSLLSGSEDDSSQPLHSSHSASEPSSSLAMTAVGSSTAYTNATNRSDNNNNNYAAATTTTSTSLPNSPTMTAPHIFQALAMSLRPLPVDDRRHHISALAKGWRIDIKSAAATTSNSNNNNNKHQKDEHHHSHHFSRNREEKLVLTVISQRLAAVSHLVRKRAPSQFFMAASNSHNAIAANPPAAPAATSGGIVDNCGGVVVSPNNLAATPRSIPAAASTGAIDRSGSSVGISQQQQQQ